MAIYHANIKNFSRGKGECATAAAAYRAGIAIVDTRTRITHDFTRRHGVISFHMIAPAGAPAWCNDASVFFDACERWESRANAIVARELEVSLPAEMSGDQRRDLALSLAQILVDRYQVVVLAALHAPSKLGDSRNFHVHLLMSSRKVGADGFEGRAGAEFDARGGKGAEEVRVVREQVSHAINVALAKAGLSEKVDHRTLRAQAASAWNSGEHDKAHALSRRPTRHIGKAITAALRRGLSDPLLVKVGIVQSRAATDMAAAEAAFARQGRLIATPASHDAQAARHDRLREQGSAKAQDREVVLGRSGARPSAGALQLGRMVRLARAQGRDAEVLNAEKKMVEDWLQAQREAAKAALESLQEIPGLQLEPQFKRAMDTSMRRRGSIYGGKQFFFEDTETLTDTIMEYVNALREPVEANDALRRARAAVMEVELDGTARSHARHNSAKRRLAKAKARLNPRAKAASEHRIRIARAAMVAATDAMEQAYHVTPLHQVETSPPHVYSAGPGGGERQSDSNRRQLVPPSRPRH